MSEIPSTLDVVAERIKNGSRPDSRHDPYKVALIFQGGAMRGVISAGAANYLLAVMGEYYPFDESHVTSSGAPVDAFFKAGAHWGASIMYEELTHDFIALRNRLAKGRFVDIGYMMSVFRDGPKALNAEAVLRHPTESNIYATSAEDAKIINFKVGCSALEAASKIEEGQYYIYNCQNPEDLFKALEATCTLPFWGGKPVELDGGLSAVDGGVSRAARIPLQMAAEAGASHVLVVVTEKNSSPDEYKKTAEEKIAALAIRRKYPRLAENYWAGHEAHQDTLRWLSEIENGGAGSPAISVVRPSEKLIPHHTETSPQKLYLAAWSGRLAIQQALKPYGLIENPNIKLEPPKIVASG